LKRKKYHKQRAKIENDLGFSWPALEALGNTERYRTIQECFTVPKEMYYPSQNDSRIL
jgi:hypothetical protein